MLLLVDGYNVTMQDERTEALSKEGQRAALLGRMRAHASRLAPGGRIVVVFDAHEQWGHASQDSGVVAEVFAPSADDEIARRCAAAAGQVVVATGDMRLRARISQDVGRHVRFKDASELFDRALKEASASRKGAPVARDSGLPDGANAITEELKKLWLSEDE
jgi:predicted RNA-binding protein with PIN domain